MRASTSSLVRASALGVLTGGLAGFSLGLLLAPNEGRTVRRRLAYLLDRWSRQLATLVDQLGSDEAQSEARASGAALIADAREQAERILHDANALMSEVQQRPSGS